MMKAAPAAALVMAKADFLLEFLIVALDAPAHHGEIDKIAERHFPVDGCQPVFGGLSLALGPFDERCLLPKRASPRVGEARTRRQAKRDSSALFVPSRHEMVR
jgi:hypothetical protein